MATTTIHKFSVDDVVFVVTVPAVVRAGSKFSTMADVSHAELRVASEVVKLGMVSGAAVRFIRKSLGFTAKQLAELLSRGPETVSHWETGATPVDRLAWAALASLVSERLGEASTTLKTLEAAAHPPRHPRVIELSP